MAHSKLGGSQAERIINCNGSVALCDKAPEESPSKYAVEGSAAHKLGELALQHGMTPRGIGADLISKKYFLLINDEMREHICFYVDTVRELVAEHYRPDHQVRMSIEQTFSLDWLHPGMWGTSDVCIGAIRGRLIVIELKYGARVAVEVENNPQLMYYGLGAAKSLGGKFDEVEIMVIQPRIDHPNGKVRSQVISMKDLEAWGRKVLRPAAIAASKPNAKRQIGKWCHFCRASGICPEKRNEVLDVTRATWDNEGEAVLRDPDFLSTNRLAKLFNFSEALGPWMKSVKANLKHRLETGEKHAGVKLVCGKSNRRWIDEKDAKEKLGKMGTSTICSIPKLKSPAQVEKLAKTDEDKELVKSLWEKPEVGLIIAVSSDPREEVDPTTAIDFFKDEKSSIIFN